MIAERIRAAIKDAKAKDKLCVVTGITTVPENRLIEIMNGAETGNRKGRVIPKREWIAEIVDYCKANQIPVFLKESLREIWGEELIQEYLE